jgi:BirA family transcriptional regulator, biotin operon repressor / biotin---[acetyl-CoA-carboxylase] ligase
VVSTHYPPFQVQTYLTRLRSLGCPLGEPLHYFSTTTSTNDEAKAAAAVGAPSGATFLADHQTTGRGRHGRQWLAPANQQLLVSVLWRPRAGVARAALTLAVGVGLHRALAPLLPASANLAVKWPNDLEARGAKLGGVLVEAGTTPEHGAHVVIGFGLNVHPLTTTDASLNPISLVELGLAPTRETLLVDLLRSLHDELEEFEQRGPDKAVGYLNRHHALAGQSVVVDGLEGTVVEVAPTGALVLETPSGRREVSTGTVERRVSSAEQSRNTTARIDKKRADAED